MLLGRSILFASGAALAMASSLLACSSGTLYGVASADAGSRTDATPPAPSTPSGTSSGCTACVTNADCKGGGVCAQVAGDSYCMPACPNGDECGAAAVCDSVATASGAPQSVCLPRTNICGSGQSAPIDAGASPPPSSGGGAVGFDGGAGVDGSVSPSGGTVSRLYFAVVGDTRPPSPDDTAGYPTQIIDSIFAGIAALKPMPSFVVSTGDYMFASTWGTEQGPQVDLYLAARARYPGLQFPALGNHECTGATASNCGAGSADGITSNYTTFLTRFLAPIHQTNPYYAVNFSAPDGSWTAKFVFVAANAWSDAQSTWLEQTLAVASTYTFVVRHESASASTAPGVTPSEAIIARHPYTFEIVGHTHSYGRLVPKAVLVGNGGAPLSGGGNYGYAVFSQQSDGTIAADMIDYASGLADATFHFAVKADGTTAP